MIAIIDYGMGNLRSVQKALEHVGAQTTITQHRDDILKAQKIVLPGVGAMQPAMEKLHHLSLIDPLKESIQEGKLFLGICLGLQLLFEKSFEGGEVEGLGILKGNVERFKSKKSMPIKIPHMGWNQLLIKNSKCPIFKNIQNLDFVYFCHSYFVNPKNKDMMATSTHYGIEFTSSIWVKNVFGVQFHPEKSQMIGLKILKNFVEL